MRISDWSSDVCSSDLDVPLVHHRLVAIPDGDDAFRGTAGFPGAVASLRTQPRHAARGRGCGEPCAAQIWHQRRTEPRQQRQDGGGGRGTRSEEHTSELQSLMRISYAVSCLKTTNTTQLQEVLQTTRNNN